VPVSSVPAELLRAPDLQMSEEERLRVVAAEEALDKLLGEQGLAKYKLEVMFSHRHSLRNATPGVVTWWESGNKLHGGGDSKLYLCENNADFPQLAGKGCGKFIPDSSNGLEFVVCPRCMTLWRPPALVGEIFYRLPVDKWADVLLDWFVRLESRTDIRVKYGRMSVRDAQTRETEKNLRGELLNKARSIEQRSCTSYPLRNILKDTNAGADLRGRLLAFLKA